MGGPEHADRRKFGQVCIFAPVTGKGRYLRLKSAIAAAIADAGESSSAAKALTDAYGRFRVEARIVAEETQTTDEFDRLFPEGSMDIMRPSVKGSGYDPIALGSATYEARVLLGSLAGWLDGFIVDK